MFHERMLAHAVGAHTLTSAHTPADRVLSADACGSSHLAGHCIRKAPRPEPRPPPSPRTIAAVITSFFMTGVSTTR